MGCDALWHGARWGGGVVVVWWCGVFWVWRWVAGKAGEERSQIQQSKAAASSGTCACWDGKPPLREGGTCSTLS